jgi:hypothetical protein
LREKRVVKPGSVKPEYKSEDPSMCIYSSRFGVWRLHYGGSVVIIHDAKHYPEARLIEDFYRDNGFNVYRINTDITGEDKLANKLLSRCKKITNIND